MKPNTTADAANLSTSTFSVLLVLCAMLLSAGRAVMADELLMRDGSRLLGEVVRRENGILRFKTSYAGVIEVKWEEVAELQSDKPMKLMLQDESTLVTKHITNDVEELTIEGDAGLPSQTLGQATVEYINPEPWRTGEGFKFSGIVNAALQIERGNTDKDELDVDGDLTWRFRHDRVKVYGEFERDRNNNKKTKDKWKLNNTYDHFFSRKWYGGAVLFFEHDQFADLNLRTTVGPTAGYQWFESKDMNLSTKIGPMYVDEDFDNEEDDDYYALGWGIDFDKYLFDEFMQFYHRQTGLWNLNDTSNVVWNTWTGVRFPLILGLVASGEFQAEYNSGAAEDADDLDTTISAKLGYAW